MYTVYISITCYTVNATVTEVNFWFKKVLQRRLSGSVSIFLDCTFKCGLSIYYLLRGRFGKPKIVIMECSFN